MEGKYMLNIIRDEFENIKVKAETKRYNMPSMEELRIRQEELIDKLRGRKDKVKEEVKVEEPAIKITSKKVEVKVPRKDIVEIDRRKNKENDERLNNVVEVKEEVKVEETKVNKPRKDIVEIDRRKNKENDDRLKVNIQPRKDIVEIDRRKNKENDERLNNVVEVKEEVKVEETKQPEVKEEVKVEETKQPEVKVENNVVENNEVKNNNVEQKVEETKPEVKVEEKEDEIDYLVRYVQSLEDEEIMNATVEDLLSDPTLYDDYNVDIIYDDYDYINEEFYGNNNEPVEEVVDNDVDDEVTDDIVFRDERSPEAISSTIQWLENIMGSTGSVNDLFNQCKKTDDENNE
jgi:hypothetical protein